MSPADTSYLDHVRGERRERAEALCAVVHPEEYAAVGGLPCVYCSRDTATLPDTLDWATLAPPAEEHDCNCQHCDLHGLEPVRYLELCYVASEADDDAYVSDRQYLVLRRDVAPVGKFYDGNVLAFPNRPRIGALVWTACDVTDEPPADDTRFARRVMRAVIIMGWSLRQLDHHPDTNDGARRGHAIVNADGEHIGWALAMTLRDSDEETQ